MLLLPTWLFPSPIHGYGCFTGSKISSGALVWMFNPEVDRVLGPCADELHIWDRIHAYGSNASGRFILCADNAAWINFSRHPNLVEAEEANGEYCLRACREIGVCEELTLFPDTDTDADWKMNRIKCA
jgi:SET domain-containing protein